MEIHSVSGFLSYLKRIRARTDRAVAQIPKTDIEWTHQPGKFTFGDLVRHLAGLERYMFAENIHGRPSRYPGHHRALADGYEVVMAYYHDLRAASWASYEALTDAQLQTRCLTPAGIEITTWKWLRAMIEHEVHHRGQLYLMLALREATPPPLFGLTAEDVEGRSLE